MDDVLPLERATEAAQRLRANRVVGKLVIAPTGPDDGLGVEFDDRQGAGR